MQATKEEIRAAIMAHAELFPIGCVGNFGCRACDRYLPYSHCAGVIAAGDFGSRPKEKVMICKDCVQGNFPD